MSSAIHASSGSFDCLSSLVGQYDPETAKPLLLTPHPLLVENINVLDQNTDLYVEMLLRKLPLLKSINVGDDSLNRTRVFALFKLKSLETVRIGIRSFYLSDQERSDGLFHIADCPKLTLIQIDNIAFADYQEMKLENLPSLESIYFGILTFLYAPTFTLTGFAFLRVQLLDLPRLRDVLLCTSSFSYVQTITMESMSRFAVANRLAHAYVAEC